MSKCGCPSRAPYWDLDRNPGMCPDWEETQGPLALQVGAESTEPHQPGLFIYFFNLYYFLFIYFPFPLSPRTLFHLHSPPSLLDHHTAVCP